MKGCMVPVMWAVTLFIIIALFAICVVLVFTTHLVIKPIIPTP